jgi:hypothetical protein
MDLKLFGDIQAVIYNKLSYTGDTKYGKLLAPDEAIADVKKELDEVFVSVAEMWKRENP